MLNLYGTVEYKEGDEWKYAFTLEGEMEISPNSTMYGLLFGIRNDANFEPNASHRGVPDDISPYTWVELNPEDRIPDTEEELDAEGNLVYDPSLEPKYYAYSWITLDEINSIDPNTQSEERDERVTHYAKTKDGLQFLSKPISPGLTKEQYAELKKNNRLEVGDSVYTHEYLKAGDVVWFNPKLEARLARLDSEYGGKNVRMVVGFDS